MRQLREAVELVQMLEQLSEGLARDPRNNAVAWGGIQLTLGQIRSLIRRADEQLDHGKESEQPRRSSEQGRSSESDVRAVSSLAGRIQKSPSGRVRDLLGTSAGITGEM